MKLITNISMLVVALAAPALCVSPASAATLIHDYEFQGDLSDLLEGAFLVSGGGIVNSNSYTFGVEDEGLSLSNWMCTASDNANYTLDFSLKFTAVAGAYAKILDTKNLTGDFGLYFYNPTDALTWYSSGDNAGPSNSFPMNQYVRIDLTRDGTSKLLVGYINGTAQFSLTDSSDLAVFAAANNIIHLFRDDTATAATEIGAGEINQFRIYSGAMSAAEVAALGGPKVVPEPSTALLGVIGLLGLYFRRSRG